MLIFCQQRRAQSTIRKNTGKKFVVELYFECFPSTFKLKPAKIILNVYILATC